MSPNVPELDTECESWLRRISDGRQILDAKPGELPPKRVLDVLLEHGLIEFDPLRRTAAGNVWVAR
jgi:hypothetical protein